MIAKFRDGSLYNVDSNGTLRKISPNKPWKNKKEHRQHKKQRRLEREEE